MEHRTLSSQLQPAPPPLSVQASLVRDQDPPSRRLGQWVAESGSSQRAMPLAPMFAASGARRAKMALLAPIPTKIGATDAARLLSGGGVRAPLQREGHVGLQSRGMT